MRMENKYSPLIQHTAAYKVQHRTFPYSTHRCFPMISYLERSMQTKVLSVPLFKQKPSAITPTPLCYTKNRCPYILAHTKIQCNLYFGAEFFQLHKTSRKKNDKLFQPHSLLKILTHITYIIP